MSAIANIVAFDGASTPVAHTLVADSITRMTDELQAIYGEKLSGVPEIAQVRTSIKRKILGSGVTRVVVRTEVPVMETAGAQNSAGYTAPPMVAYVDTYETVGYFHPRSMGTGRKLARQLHINILNNVSTSVVPASSGPAVEAFDSLVMPT